MDQVFFLIVHTSLCLDGHKVCTCFDHADVQHPFWEGNFLHCLWVLVDLANNRLVIAWSPSPMPCLLDSCMFTHFRFVTVDGNPC